MSKPYSVMPLDGGQGGLQLTRNLGVQLTLLQPGGQIMPTILLLEHPDLKTQRHHWYSNPMGTRVLTINNFANQPQLTNICQGLKEVQMVEISSYQRTLVLQNELESRSFQIFPLHRRTPVRRNVDHLYLFPPMTSQSTGLLSFDWLKELKMVNNSSYADVTEGLKMSQALGSLGFSQLLQEFDSQC